MAADVGKMRVVRDASNESLHSVPQGLEIFNDIVAEGEGLDATVADIGLCLGRIRLEGQLMTTMEEENFEMLDLGVGEQDNILAEVRAGLACGHVDVERRIINGLIFKLDLLEALALVGARRVSSADLGREDGQKLSNGTRITVRVSV